MCLGADSGSVQLAFSILRSTHFIVLVFGVYRPGMAYLGNKVLVTLVCAQRGLLEFLLHFIWLPENLKNGSDPWNVSV